MSVCAKIDKPLHVFEENEGFSKPSSVLLPRMKGGSVVDCFGDRLRTDRENWFTLPQAMAYLSKILGAMPQRSLIANDDEDTVANLRRFNEEFGYEVAPSNRKAG